MTIKNQNNINSPFLSDFIENKKPLPKYLYKYRYFDEKGYHVDALLNESIWLSNANNLDDPIESTLKYRYQKKDFRNFYNDNFIDLFKFILEENNIKYDVSDKEFNEFKDSCFTKNAKLKKNEFITYFQNKGVETKKIKKILRTIDEYKKIIFSKPESEVSNYINGQLMNLNTKLGELFITCSFSEDKNNNQMWAQYSNNHSGFIIEYDTNLLNEKTRKSFSKIIYGEKPKINIFDLLMMGYYNYNNSIPESFAKDLVLNLLTKSNEWSSQQEWRLIPFQETERLFKFPYISGIYLGNKISKENENYMINLAKTNNYKIYKLVKDSVIGEMVYKKIVL